MSLKNERLPKRYIFVNYRREDTAGHAGRLFDRLSNRFPDRVFMDIDTIEPGIDFVEIIHEAVGCCEVLIVMIGRDWLDLTDTTGRRRLDNPSDFVRLEVAEALKRNIRIIPVLVEGAMMPRPEDLPEDLGKLTRRNAIELSDARWAFDVERLIETIEGVLQDKAPSALLPATTLPVVTAAVVQPTPPPVPETPKPRAWPRAVLAFSIAVLALAAWMGWRLGNPMPDQKNPQIVPAETPAAGPTLSTELIEAVLKESERADKPRQMASSKRPTRTQAGRDTSKTEERKGFLKRGKDKAKDLWRSAKNR